MTRADLTRVGQLAWKPALVFLHIAKTIFWFRDINLSSGLPFVNVDYIQFYARVLRIHDFLRSSGRIWGYDPFDMAGAISGPFHEVGVHALALATYVLTPVMPVATSLLMLEMAGLALLPFLAFPILRLFKFDGDTAWMGFGVWVLMLGVGEPFSSSMLKVGLWGFMVSGVCGILQVALLLRWLERRGAGAWAAMTAFAAVLFQIHPTSVVVVLVPAAVLYLSHARGLGWRGHAALAGTCTVLLGTNWYWMSPFLAFSHWRGTAPYYETAGLVDVFAQFGPVQRSLFASMQAMISCSAVVLSAVAIGRLAQSRPILARTLAVWIVSLFVISYFGSWIPGVKTLQPGRNEFVLLMLLYLLAATPLKSHVFSARRPRMVAALFAGALVLFMFESFPGFSPWWMRTMSLRTELPLWQDALISDLRRRSAPAGTMPDGRILLECADDLNPNVSDLIPRLTGAILLGGQHPGNFLLTRFSLFTGYWIAGSRMLSTQPRGFNRNLQEMDEKTFGDYLALYNVSLVGARLEETISVLERMKETLIFDSEVPPYRFYCLRRPGTWFYQGGGQLSVDYDRVTVVNASSGTIVPRVHWFDTFVAEPPVPIAPVFLMDDPVPFLSIDNSAGHPRIDITNGGLPPVWTRLRRRLAGKKSW